VALIALAAFVALVTLAVRAAPPAHSCPPPIARSPVIS
jgi:hypothetical protein